MRIDAGDGLVEQLVEVAHAEGGQHRGDVLGTGAEVAVGERGGGLATGTTSGRGSGGWTPAVASGLQRCLTRVVLGPERFRGGCTFGARPARGRCRDSPTRGRRHRTYQRLGGFTIANGLRTNVDPSVQTAGRHRRWTCGERTRALARARRRRLDAGGRAGRGARACRSSAPVPATAASRAPATRPEPLGLQLRQDRPQLHQLRELPPGPAGRRPAVAPDGQRQPVGRERQAPRARRRHAGRRRRGAVGGRHPLRPDPAGHVAYVEAVHGDTIEITDDSHSGGTRRVRITRGSPVLAQPLPPHPRLRPRRRCADGRVAVRRHAGPPPSSVVRPPRSAAGRRPGGGGLGRRWRRHRRPVPGRHLDHRQRQHAARACGPARSSSARPVTCRWWGTGTGTGATPSASSATAPGSSLAPTRPTRASPTSASARPATSRWWGTGTATEATPPAPSATAPGPSPTPPPSRSSRSSSFQLGGAGDRPVVGDWDATRGDTVGLYRDGTCTLPSDNSATPRRLRAIELARRGQAPRSRALGAQGRRRHRDGPLAAPRRQGRFRHVTEPPATPRCRWCGRAHRRPARPGRPGVLQGGLPAGGLRRPAATQRGRPERIRADRRAERALDALRDRIYVLEAAIEDVDRDRAAAQGSRT